MSETSPTADKGGHYERPLRSHRELVQQSIKDPEYAAERERLEREGDDDTGLYHRFEPTVEGEDRCQTCGRHRAHRWHYPPGFWVSHSGRSEP